MIEHLKSGMTAGTKLAAVDGMIRIAFELFRQAHLDEARASVAHDFGVAFHYANERAAAGRTQSANARLPGGDAGNEIFIGYETDELLLRTATGFKGGYGARESRNFEEVTPLHLR